MSRILKVEAVELDRSYAWWASEGRLELVGVDMVPFPNLRVVEIQEVPQGDDDAILITVATPAATTFDVMVPATDGHHVIVTILDPQTA